MAMMEFWFRRADNVGALTSVSSQTFHRSTIKMYERGHN